jgi:superfamily I DNA/RNA helicase
VKILTQVRPTPEQLLLIKDIKPGIELIKGAAGKTTTAILKLKQLSAFWRSYFSRDGNSDPVRVLLLTYTKTLCGYIRELAESQLSNTENLEVDIMYFAQWAQSELPDKHVLGSTKQEDKIGELARSLPYSRKIIMTEVEYVMGRFLPENIGDYVDCKRIGRGVSPRFEKSLRTQVINEVILPYQAWKNETNRFDWNDFSIDLARNSNINPYQIIIVDESQDFSANQLRAVMNYADSPSTVTFVLDAAQRIYARGFTWKEAGISVEPKNVFKLARNYRNSAEICSFALPLLKDIELGDDATYPDSTVCPTTGVRPIVLKSSRYEQQAEYAINYIRANIDIQNETVGFLKPAGGQWFRELLRILPEQGLPYVELTGNENWPDGPENIALSTMHSAKGLEFDYVIIIGLDAKNTPHGEGEDDSELQNYRRLLAMAIMRAKKGVILGARTAYRSKLFDYLAPGTFDEITL